MGIAHDSGAAPALLGAVYNATTGFRLVAPTAYRKPHQSRSYGLWVFASLPHPEAAGS